MTTPSDHLRAVLYALTAFAIWTMGDCLTKIVGQSQLQPAQIIIGSSLFCSLTIVIIAAARGRLKALKTTRLKLELVRALLYTAQSFCNVIAFTQLPLSTVYIGLFCVPLLVSITSATTLKERLEPKQIAALVAGFAGILVAILPDLSTAATGHHGGYIALAFFPVLASINVVLVRFLGRTETPESMALIPIAARAPLVLPICVVQYQAITPFNWLVFAGMGLCGGIGFLLMNSALKKAPAGLTQSFMYSQFVIGTILGYFLWGDIPSVHHMVGAGIIVIAGLYMMHHTRRASRATLVLESPT